MNPPTAAPPEHVRILLSEASSSALLAVGSSFVVACRQTHPEDGSRIMLHLIPCSFEQGNQAVAVALGTMRAKPIKPPIASRP